MKNTRTLTVAFLLMLTFGLFTPTKAERGVASYYHNKFHGRKMANGEPYHRDSFTCAHRRYPLGSWLRVMNPKNGKAVVVKVTDRGPFSRNFTIDLSLAAARHLDIIVQGHAPVEISQVSSQTSGIVPFKMEEEPEEVVDIELDFVPAAEYPFPDWAPDSIE